MYGPQPGGTWSSLEAPNCGRDHQMLKAGRRFRVIREFRDFDGDVHPAGESWIFRGYSFLPYEDGLSWFVSMDGDREWHIRMQWRAEEQAPVIDALERYLVEDAGAAT
jgi:hypothetical protein